jgi:hypothetical protein
MLPSMNPSITTAVVAPMYSAIQKRVWLTRRTGHSGTPIRRTISRIWGWFRKAG